MTLLAEAMTWPESVFGVAVMTCISIVAYFGLRGEH